MRWKTPFFFLNIYGISINIHRISPLNTERWLFSVDILWIRNHCILIQYVKRHSKLLSVYTKNSHLSVFSGSTEYCGYGYIAYWYNMFFFLGGYGYIAYWYNIYLFWLDTDTLHTKTIRKKTLKAYLLVNWMRWKTLFLFFLFYQDPIESDSWSDSAVDVVKDCEDTFPESTLQDIFRRWYWRHWKTLFRDVTFQKKLLKTPFRIDTARHLSVSFSEMTFQNEG